MTQSALARSPIADLTYDRHLSSGKLKNGMEVSCKMTHNRGPQTRPAGNS